METPFAAPALGCLVASSTPCTASPHVGWDDVVSGGTHSHSVDVSLHGVPALSLVCVLPPANATRTRALGACAACCAPPGSPPSRFVTSRRCDPPDPQASEGGRTTPGGPTTSLILGAWSGADFVRRPDPFVRFLCTMFTVRRRRRPHDLMLARCGSWPGT
jgi:hypothetical protein